MTYRSFISFTFKWCRPKWRFKIYIKHLGINAMLRQSELTMGQRIMGQMGNKNLMGHIGQWVNPTDR